MWLFVSVATFYRDPQAGDWARTVASTCGGRLPLRLRGEDSNGDLVPRHRLVEPLQRHVTDRGELERLALTQLAHDVRDEHLVGLRAVADARRLDHREPEEVVVIGDRLAGVQPDAHPHLAAREPSAASGPIVSRPVLSGLTHEYEREAA